MTFALAFLFSGAVAQAQIGSLRGTVTDPQRAVVADASVSLESVDLSHNRADGWLDRYGEMSITALSGSVAARPILGPGRA